jgi:hypothetical protein
MNSLRYKKPHKPRIPNLLPDEDTYYYSCDSYGCDLIVRDKYTNRFIPHYIFIPKLRCYDNQRELNDAPINCVDFVYCKECFENKRYVKYGIRENRIRSEWTKDDYGYMENIDCDFCGEKCQRVKLREAAFTTNDEYCGIRSDTVFIIGVCNACIKKTPKEVFTLVNTREESNEHILNRVSKIKRYSKYF